MKRPLAALASVVCAAAGLYALEFFLFRHHHSLPILKIKVTFWLDFAVCAAIWLFVSLLAAAAQKPRGASAPKNSKKEQELEEKLSYLSRIYQELSNSLRLEKQKVESIIGCAPDGIFTCRADGAVASWNRSMENLTEMPAKEAIGKHYADCLTFYSAQGQRLVDPFASCLALGENVSLPDCRIETGAGRNVPVALGAAPVLEGNKGAEQIIVTVKDIRSQKEADKLKEEMTAMITHDLRSPVSAMLGYAGLIQNPKLCRSDEDRDKYLDALIRSGKGMLILINNLLRTAVVEEGRISVNREPTSLKPLLDESAENIAVLAKAKNLALTVDVPEGTWAIADREKLHEIMTNLITNAIKFSRAGESIRIAAAASGDRVNVSVSDSGPGISEEEKARLFEKFSTVKKQGSATGLGLYIVSKLVAALGGTISVESEPGKGSTFVISLEGHQPTPVLQPVRQLTLIAPEQGK